MPEQEDFKEEVFSTNEAGKVDEKLDTETFLAITSKTSSELNIKSIEEAIFILDHSGRFTYLNDNAETAFGSSSATLLGKTLWEGFPSAAGSNFGEFYRQVMAKNRPGHLEDRSLLTNDWYDVHAYPIKEGLLVTLQDITMFKHAEEDLKSSQERFRSAFELSGIGMALIDLGGQYLQVNTAFCQLLGYTREELLRTNFKAVTHPADLNNDIEQINRLLANQAYSYEIEKRYLHKNGTVIWVQLTRSLVRDGQGQPSYYISQMQDITERKRAEQALRVSEARLDGIIKAATDAIITLNLQYHIVLFNRAAEQMFGWTAEQMLGQPLNRLLPPRFRQIHVQHIRDYARTGVTMRPINSAATLRGFRSNNEEFPIEATISQVEAEGQIFLTVTITDLTEREKAAKSLLDKEEQLRQAHKMESIGRLAGGVAHDFNNLLTAINGYSNLILGQLDKSNRIYDDVNEILKAGNRAAMLTRQLLAFSRQQMLQPTTLNLNDLITDMDKLLQRLLGEDIELTTVLAPNLGQVLADPSQIEQIILNLAVNARDAMPVGGKLIIETANVELDENYHSIGYAEVKGGSYVMLAISDTGIGMDKATQAKIFDPFFTTKEAGKGTGMGLATVYGIVLQSEGYIWVYSVVGGGTTFKVYLPRVTAFQEANQVDLQNAAKAARPERAKTTNQHRTVLVVEDEIQVRELVQRVLQEAGYIVLEASNGEEALEFLEHWYGKEIDVVLTDIVMPVMRGSELLKRLKERWPNLRAVCMSGYTNYVALHQDQLEHCDAFLQKPFTIETLLDSIEGAIVQYQS